jgi:hypothetical protein
MHCRAVALCGDELLEVRWQPSHKLPENHISAVGALHEERGEQMLLQGGWRWRLECRCLQGKYAGELTDNFARDLLGRTLNPTLLPELRSVSTASTWLLSQLGVPADQPLWAEKIGNIIVFYADDKGRRHLGEYTEQELLARSPETST